MTISLSQVAIQIENYVNTAVADQAAGKATAIETIVADFHAAYEVAKDKVEELAEAEAPVVVSAFELALSQVGQLVANTVVALFGAAGAGLSGGEKANLAATTVVQAATAQGKALAAQDLTTLIKNSFIAASNILTPAAATN